MITEKLTGEDLLRLQNEKGNICVSVIVPTHRKSPERRGDSLEVEKAIEKAKRLLLYKYTEEQAKPLSHSMDEIYDGIDFLHNTEGIGLFISPNLRMAVRFPFTVEEKIMAGDSFETRDLLYHINYALPYFTLLLTEKGGRLFEGRWKEITEIADNHWPVEYRDDYEYSKPVRSSSYAGHAHVKIYEKDKSELEAIRFKNFYQRLDDALDAYLLNNIPLILLGPERELPWFEEVTKHKKNVLGKITGSYSHSNLKAITEMAWPVMFEHLQDERKQLVREFEEKIGERLGISGIQQVWEAAGEGKGLKLLVEKDYRCPGFIAENDHHLHLIPPSKPHKILADAVNELIETMIEKGGNVYFTDNEMLKDYGRVALIKRYE